MGNLTDQQRIEQLEKKFREFSQRISAQIHPKVAQIEEKLATNQASIETKYSKLEKSVAVMVENQLKMQETLDQLLMRQAIPQNSYYPNLSQNVPRNFLHSTTHTINPMPLPSLLLVQNKHSLITKPTLTSTHTNSPSQNETTFSSPVPTPDANRDAQNILPKPNPIPATLPPPNPAHKFGSKEKAEMVFNRKIWDNLGRIRTQKVKKGRIYEGLNQVLITKRWRKIKRRWKIRKKIRKKKIRMAVAGRFGGYRVDGKRRVESFCGQSKGVLVGGGGDIRLKTVMDLKLLGFLGLVREEKKRRKGKNEGGSCGWSEEETAGKFWSTNGGEEGQSVMFGYGCWNASSNLGFRKRAQALIKRGVLLFNFDDVIDDTSTYETSRPSMNLWGHGALVDFILRVAQTILSPLPCVNLRIFSPLFTPILDFDPFIFQVHTPIFVTRFRTEFSFNIPNSATYGKFFLNRLSSFS